MRRLAVGLVGTAIVISSLAIAAPAQAADASVSCAASASQGINASGSAFTIAFAQACQSFSWNLTSGSGVVVKDNNGIQTTPAPSRIGLTGAGTTIAITASGSAAVVSVRFFENASPNAPTITDEVIVTFGGGSESASVNTSVVAARPVQETLTLAVEASGASCSGGNRTGFSGDWLALPKAEDCKQTSPNAKAGVKLLGWSTHANFPVAAAQSQIDKGWGVIDSDFGGTRMIFIPAGMSTLVSGSNTLYPVWSA